MEPIVQRVWEYSLKNPDGFTLNIRTFDPVVFGIAVAYRETQNSTGIEGLKKAIDHAKKNDNVIGGWLDEETGLYYFDSVKIFTRQKEAVKFGIENEQKAIFDLTNLREIRI